MKTKKSMQNYGSKPLANEADEEGFHELAEQFRGVGTIEKERKILTV